MTSEESASVSVILRGKMAIQVLVYRLGECLKPHDPKRGITIESPDFVDFVGNFNTIVWLRPAIYSFPQLLHP